MDHHSRLTPEKLPKNHMELLSSFLRRLRLRIMIWLQKHRANTLKPNCSHWLHYKVHRNPWKETKYSGHSIKRDHIKVPGHHLDPLPKHTDGTPPGPLHSHLGALPSLLQKPLQPLDPIFPGAGFPGICPSRPSPWRRGLGPTHLQISSIKHHAWHIAGTQMPAEWTVGGWMDVQGTCILKN